MILLLFLTAVLSNATVQLDEPKFAYDRISQIKAGAKAFMQSCYSCHTMSYLRTDEVSLEAGINPDSAPQWDASSWNGHPPPDLSLITAIKGIDYVYSYLRGYYVDESHPSGYENIVMPGTQMPNPFVVLQGNQVKLNVEQSNPRLHEVLELQVKGNLKPQAFNDYVSSIVSYLDYASDPSILVRNHYGVYVLVFLLVMIVVMIGLDLVYWSDIHGEHYEK